MNTLMRSSNASLQMFINQLWGKVQDIQSHIDHFEHHKTRIEKVSSENRIKVEGEYTVFVAEFKKIIRSFVEDFSSPYFCKIEVHHPEIAKTFLQYKQKILHNKSVKGLF